jgi:hypothetical protein
MEYATISCKIDVHIATLVQVSLRRAAQSDERVNPEQQRPLLQRAVQGEP